VNERPSSLERLLSAHRRVALDSNVLIYLAEDAGTQGEAAALLIATMNRLKIEIIFATIGLADVLAGPSRTGDVIGFEHMADDLRDLGLQLVALDASIAEDAAWLRGRARLDLVDAVHVATARAAGATLFVTNDRDVVSTSHLEVAYLDDLVA
jgi:predicted nucleic acid-binding protein